MRPVATARYPGTFVVGPLEPTTYATRTAGTTPTRWLDAGFTIRCAIGQWEHYTLASGSVTMARNELNRLVGTYTLKFDRVKKVTNGQTTSEGAANISITGRLAQQY